MAHDEWKTLVLQNEEEYVASQKRIVLSKECQIMFHRIDDLSLNIDKLTNVNHPVHHERIKADLSKPNYRRFCFRMIKGLVIEITEMVLRLLTQIREKPMKTWLERIEHGTKKILLILSEHFCGLERLMSSKSEENDELRRAEKRNELDQDMVHNIRRYTAHLVEAKREIHTRLLNCKLRSDEQVGWQKQKLNDFDLPHATIERHQIDRAVSQSSITSETAMASNDEERYINLNKQNKYCHYENNNEPTSENRASVKEPECIASNQSELPYTKHFVKSSIKSGFLHRNKIPHSLSNSETPKRKRCDIAEGLCSSFKKAKAYWPEDLTTTVSFATKLQKHSPNSPCYTSPKSQKN